MRLAENPETWARLHKETEASNVTLKGGKEKERNCPFPGNSKRRWAGPFGREPKENGSPHCRMSGSSKPAFSFGHPVESGPRPTAQGQSRRTTPRQIRFQEHGLSLDGMDARAFAKMTALPITK